MGFKSITITQKENRSYHKLRISYCHVYNIIQHKWEFSVDPQDLYSLWCLNLKVMFGVRTFPSVQDGFGHGSTLPQCEMEREQLFMINQCNVGNYHFGIEWACSCCRTCTDFYVYLMCLSSSNLGNVGFKSIVIIIKGRKEQLYHKLEVLSPS